VTFNPWWTVPQSIIRTMSGFGGYEVRQGNGYRIVRQPPGPRNALGRIKIEMPTSMRSTSTTPPRRTSSTRSGAPLQPRLHPHPQYPRL
jgi:hypothetical protein